jgi:hypothetical protein
MSRRRDGAAALLLGAACALCACDLGPLGSTALRGEPAREPVRDWSFLEPRYTIDVETHAASLLPSTHAWFVVHEGALWLYAMSTPTLAPPWVERLRDVRPDVTIGVDGRLHQGRAALVEDLAALEPLLPLVLRKYHGIATARARWLPHPARHPGTQIRHWFFRVEPAESGVP